MLTAWFLNGSKIDAAFARWQLIRSVEISAKANRFVLLIVFITDKILVLSGFPYR